MDYKEDLKNKLLELKKIEGFPLGIDEDILALSDPPYFTACPNPYIADFIKENGKPYDESTDNYHREPFVGDVSEGKTDAVYMAHTYHTKVPYKAIIKYIDHYTNEGDIILDGFSGSGMTGVAAKVSNRNCILSDLSPIASLMGTSISSKFDIHAYKSEFVKIILKTTQEFAWLYETNHSEKLKGEINYIIWSETLACPFCNTEYLFWEQAFSKETKSLNTKYICPGCSAEISKSTSNSVEEKYFDEFTQSESKRLKYVPVLINYKFQGKTFVKKPDASDIETLNRINDFKISYWVPTYEYMFKSGKWGDMWRSGVHYGITHTHHFFTKRSLIIFSRLFDLAAKSNNKKQVIYTLTSFLTKTGSRLHNIEFKGGKINLAGAQPNSLYIPSLYAERNLLSLALGKCKDIEKAFKSIENSSYNTCCQVASTTNIPISNNSIDYIFTDPPFGENLMYSEMNFIWESWLKVFTNNSKEAIINNSQNKNIDSYFDLMYSSFKEYYRVLKPNRWITVVFHNSKSSVWNVLQNALSRSGFIISQVSILDKQQGTKNQMITLGAVEKDLVISAFKPKSEFDIKLISSGGANFEKEFIKEFLSNQPIRPVIERIEKMLYSKMLSFYIQRGYEINMDAKSFYQMLSNNFIEQDGFWFTTEQITQYEEYMKKMKLEGIDELKSGSMFLFVTDEKSALVWLYNFLSEAINFSDIHSAFTQLANIRGDIVPDLRELLEQNFIFENNKYRRPKSEPEHSQISDKREKTLLREFEFLLIKTQTEKGKIKLVRKEALLYGFETCYKSRRYQDILTVTNKLDKAIIENSSELNDFVEAAEIMVKGME